MSRARARELAKTFLERGDAKGWFESLYAEADGADLDVRPVVDRPADGAAERIPWADLVPNPHLVSWLDENHAQVEGRRALVVGCGLGDDAELLDQAEH